MTPLEASCEASVPADTRLFVGGIREMKLRRQRLCHLDTGQRRLNQSNTLHNHLGRIPQIRTPLVTIQPSQLANVPGTHTDLG